LNALAKLGIAVVVIAILLLNPIGACAQSMQADRSPSHPCCPANKAPKTDHCAKPGCVCVTTTAAETVEVANDTAGPLLTLPAVASADALPTGVTGTAAPERPLYSPPERYIGFHQLLI